MPKFPFNVSKLWRSHYVHGLRGLGYIRNSLIHKSSSCFRFLFGNRSRWSTVLCFCDTFFNSDCNFCLLFLWIKAYSLNLRSLMLDNEGVLTTYTLELSPLIHCSAVIADISPGVSGYRSAWNSEWDCNSDTPSLSCYVCDQPGKIPFLVHDN